MPFVCLCTLTLWVYILGMTNIQSRKWLQCSFLKESCHVPHLYRHTAMVLCVWRHLFKFSFGFQRGQFAPSPSCLFLQQSRRHGWLLHTTRRECLAYIWFWKIASCTDLWTKLSDLQELGRCFFKEMIAKCLSNHIVKVVTPNNFPTLPLQISLTWLESSKVYTNMFSLQFLSTRSQTAAWHNGKFRKLNSCNKVVPHPAKRFKSTNLNI